MKMYTLADHAIKPEEFSRAATICSGKVLSPYVVKTVYQVLSAIFEFSKSYTITFFDHFFFFFKDF